MKYTKEGKNQISSFLDIILFWATLYVFDIGICNALIMYL